MRHVIWIMAYDAYLAKIGDSLPALPLSDLHWSGLRSPRRTT